MACISSRITAVIQVDKVTDCFDFFFDFFFLGGGAVGKITGCFDLFGFFGWVFFFFLGGGLSW